MPILFTPIPAKAARHYQAGGTDANGQRPERVLSDGDGNPCRLGGYFQPFHIIQKAPLAVGHGRSNPGFARRGHRAAGAGAFDMRLVDGRPGRGDASGHR